MSAASDHAVPAVTAEVPETSAVANGPGFGAPALALVGILTIVVSAWGGIAPYVGPLFGYRPAGPSAWHWTLAHALLALAPGAVGVLAGCAMLSAAGRVRYGLGRTSLAASGVLAFACGAWFVIGPTAWRVLESQSALANGATPLSSLANLVGAALGPGVVLALLGGTGIGWALRHRSVGPVALHGRHGGVARHLTAVGASPVGS